MGRHAAHSSLFFWMAALLLTFTIQAITTPNAKNEVTLDSRGRPDAFPNCADYVKGQQAGVSAGTTTIYDAMENIEAQCGRSSTTCSMPTCCAWCRTCFKSRGGGFTAARPQVLCAKWAITEDNAKLPTLDLGACYRDLKAMNESFANGPEASPAADLHDGDLVLLAGANCR